MAADTSAVRDDEDLLSACWCELSVPDVKSNPMTEDKPQTPQVKSISPPFWCVLIEYAVRSSLVSVTASAVA
ncbi:hypothetical protein E4U54_008322 [Claviceps lovelessii]|nr:hypothetical protein E4U54_008322 [Claviceps lovelessii]